MAAASSPRGGRLERAYIHVVQPIDRTHRGRHHDTPESAREAWDKAGVVFVETFVDAALDACSRKFISPLGLRRVGVAAKKDFESVQWAVDDRRKDMRRQELDDALRRLNRALVVDYGLDAVPLCDAVAPVSVRKRKSGSIVEEGTIEPGRAVVTPVGPGIVLSSRTSKDIGLVYEVALDEWRLCDRNPAKAYVPSSQIVYEQSRKTALEAFRSSKQEPAPTSASDADWMGMVEARRRTDSAGSLGEAAGRAQ